LDITALILDVDGVLTDGRLYYGPSGESHKVFHVHDGSALKAWRSRGGHVALLSGRDSPMVAVRAAELGIVEVRQGIDDKLPVFEDILSSWGVRAAACAYVGDDMADLGPMMACGYPIAVSNAISQVREVAAFVTSLAGGYGAVREAIDHLLQRIPS
jgi:3-deoxy-D-manno-octulosonate 8-phosphate phosphatase (KDO 8-P phosphatase)